MNTWLLLTHNLSVLKTFLHIEEPTQFITLMALYEFLILIFFLYLDFYLFSPLPHASCTISGVQNP